MVRDLIGTVASDSKFDGGIFISMYQPTDGMIKAANKAGTFKGPAQEHHPLVQLLTVPELLAGAKPDLPLIIPPYTEARPVNEVIQDALPIED